MEMPGRSVGSDYKYGMNGQMKENEVFEGFMSADYWGYDARLGRRWEQDPLAYPWQSPYATFNNNPIYYADPLGLEGEPGPNEEGHIYDCGDNTCEIFRDGQYVPAGGYGGIISVNPNPNPIPEDFLSRPANRDYLSRSGLDPSQIVSLPESWPFKIRVKNLILNDKTDEKIKIYGIADSSDIEETRIRNVC